MIITFNFRAARRLREKQRQTLRVVAEAVGIDSPSLSRLERGHVSNPTIRTVYTLARALGCKPDALVRVNWRASK